MSKLTLISDSQLVADAAQLLIENHLHWSGSNETFPSRDLDGVRGQVVSAFVYSAIDNGLAADGEDLTFWREQAVALYKQAAKLADRKWLAAMTLLGIEQ